MIVLDTCALVWWTLDPARLSRKAEAICRRIDLDGALISSISLWEIGIKIKKGKLDIGLSLEGYVSRLKKMNALQIVPVDETIWLENLALPWNHDDPVDRTIVATARLRDLPLLTADRVIRKFYSRATW